MTDFIQRRIILPSFFALLLLPPSVVVSAAFDDKYDLQAMPSAPPGFEVKLFAKEPLVSNPCAMAFDTHGRLFIGMGAQWRNPTPQTIKDSVVIIEDCDGDGVADRRHTFATGFNSVQSIAWRGRDLWVANSPDLTVVRDLDGDDVADEYVKVFTDLGNIEHCLHGLNWGPDGMLYMSKGNSKGVSLGGAAPKEPGRIAPKAFRELWGYPGPQGAQDLPPAQTFTRDNYNATYQDPRDDWGQTGGILRYDPDRPSLEIYARGFRNPWDMAFDSAFNWLGTDNDQTGGDRVFMPFRRAHFGWGHPWSPTWPGADHLPTASNSGQIIEGSYAGIVFADTPHLPESHRGVWFIADWLRKAVYLYRPTWRGALNVPQDGKYEEFIKGGTALFRPTDVTVGPYGALWVLGWGVDYGGKFNARGEQINEGRVYRIVAKDRPLVASKRPVNQHAQWSFDELLADLASWVPAWQIDARDELICRGKASIGPLKSALNKPSTTAQETWAAWTLARLSPAAVQPENDNLRLQLIRAGLADINASLRDANPRFRLAAIETTRAKDRDALIELLAAETDAVIYHAAWRTVMAFSGDAEMRVLTSDTRPGIRRAGVLMRMETLAITETEVLPLLQDKDESLRTLAAHWLSKIKGTDVTKPNAISDAYPLARNILSQSRGSYVTGTVRAGDLHYTDRKHTIRTFPAFLAGASMIRTANDDDGSAGDAFLTFESPLDVTVYVAHDERVKTRPAWLAAFGDSDSVLVTDDGTYRLYAKDFPAGSITLGGNTHDGKSGGKGNYSVILTPKPPAPSGKIVTLDAALAVMPNANPQRGEALFFANGGAGCAACHQMGARGHAFGPDLAGAGDRFDARHILDSMLNPGAVITEGFAMMNVTMKDGSAHGGVMREQSALTLTLAQPGGTLVKLDRKNVVKSEMLPVSTMPPFAAMLSAQQLADLTAFLIAQKASVAIPQGAGFHFEKRADRLIITHSGKPAAHFVFRDAKIPRPFFTHLHAPDGTQVTRNFPPVKGRDATDHDTMHPGLWLAFGDINGVDFWRNKGRIEHARFISGPSVEGGRLTFAVEEKYLAPDGTEVCRGVNEFCFVAGETLQPALPGMLLMWDTTLRRADGPLTFGPQHEMGLGFRVATPLVVKGGTGSIRSSHGGQNESGNWGRIGTWWDYSGTMNGRHTGILAVAAADNARAIWSHARDYGFLAMNPTGPPPGAKDVPSVPFTVPAGETLRLKFGILLHVSTASAPLDPARAASIISTALNSWK